MGHRALRTFYVRRARCVCLFRISGQVDQLGDSPQRRQQTAGDVVHRQPERGGVDAWVTAQPWLAEQIPVYEKVDAVLRIGHEAQNAYGAGGQSQKLVHMLGIGK